jgi:hypothetical protein
VRALLVIPFAMSESDPWWHTLSAASLTSVQDHVDPCVIVLASPPFVSDTSALGEAQRLVILAVDFGDRAGGGVKVPLGPGAFERRPRVALQSAADAEDRRCIAVRLEALLGLAGPCGHHV